MFKYTGSQTSTSMSNTLLKKANGKESKLKKVGFEMGNLKLANLFGICKIHAVL